MIERLELNASNINSQIDRSAPLWQAAKALERSFVSEMLKSAGLGSNESSFGGGVGEEQFASLLRDAQAEAMVDAGGIGLAESIYDALLEE